MDGSVPRIGDILGGKYILLKFLNQGNSGMVFTAMCTRHSGEVVLKLIHFCGEWSKKEFEREVNHLRLCEDSPLVVNLKDSFQHQQYGVVVLEKLDGDLLDVMQNSPSPLSIDFVKDIFYQVCVSVQFIHKKRIAHLDIKPENIFMANSSSIKLGDFGSSYQWFGDFQEKIGAVGTFYYCAPEVGSRPYDPRKADVWSLGILLHVLLTGFWPFKEADDDTLRESVVLGKTFLFTHLLPMDDCLLNLLRSILCTDARTRISLLDILSSDWLADVDHPIENTTQGTSFIDTFQSPGQTRTEDVTRKKDSYVSHSHDIFSLSDEEGENREQKMEMSEDDSWEIEAQVPRINLEPDEFGIAGSLPHTLIAEEIKEPKSFITPTPTNHSSIAAPIGPKARRSRRSSVIKFFSSRRSSSAFEGLRTKKRVP